MVITDEKRGSDIREGDTVVVVDDEHISREFTLGSRISYRERFQTFPVKRTGTFLSFYDHNLYLVKRKVLSSQEKLDLILAGLRADASNPISKQLLAEIGES